MEVVATVDKWGEISRSVCTHQRFELLAQVARRECKTPTCPFCYVHHMPSFFAKPMFFTTCCIPGTSSMLIEKEAILAVPRIFRLVMFYILANRVLWIPFTRKAGAAVFLSTSHDAVLHLRSPNQLNSISKAVDCLAM